jgi:tRNA-dihydrouridine synthase C
VAEASALRPSEADAEIALAPMEGLVDDILRDVLTRVGGVDWCVSEFVRVNDRLLPAHVFQRLAPELARGAHTAAGTPMRLQLLGSDPQCLAENAAFAASLGAPVIDLNFGCPANTVNKSRGGSVLLKEPELLYRIATAVRAALPQQIPLTAKMRLGYVDTSPALDCARALEAGGATQLVVHARTKVQGYQPPAHWHWIARIADAVRVPVFANGEVWTVADWQACRAESGVAPLMLGRGLIARPDLALQIRAARIGAPYTPMRWASVEPLVQEFWQQVRRKLPTAFAPGRLKQWLCWLARSYPEAASLFGDLRRVTDCLAIDQKLLGNSTPALAEAS